MLPTFVATTTATSHGQPPPTTMKRPRPISYTAWLFGETLLVKPHLLDRSCYEGWDGSWSVQQRWFSSSSSTSRTSSSRYNQEVEPEEEVLVVDSSSKQQLTPSPKNLSDARSMAEDLIQKKKNLIDTDLQTARTILTYILDEEQNHHHPDAETIQVSIRLLERIVLDHSRTKTNQTSSTQTTNTTQKTANHQRLILKPWYCHPDFYNPILERWKTLAMHTNPKIRERVIAPASLGDKLYQLSQLTRHDFSYNLRTITIVMEAIIHRTPIQQRPTVAERMVQFLQQEAHDSKRSDLEPNLTIYTHVLQAWLDVIDIFPDRATQSIQSWLTRIRNEGIRVEEDDQAMKLVLKIASNIGLQQTKFPLLQELLRNHLVPELSTLTEKSKRLEHTITQLEKQLVQHTSMADQLLQRVQSLTEDAKEVDEMVQFKTDRIQDLETSIQELHQRVDELQNENNSYRTQLKKLQPKPEYVEPKTKNKTTTTTTTTTTRPVQSEEEEEKKSIHPDSSSSSSSSSSSEHAPVHPRPRGRAPKGTDGWDPHRGAWIKRNEDQSTVYF
jgi:uncharacterized protein YoxC